MSYVVDASVAAKWFFREPGQEMAEQLLAIDRPLYAPDLIVAEVTNVLWKRWRTASLSPDYATGIVRTLPTLFEQLLPGGFLADAAWQWSHTLDHPAYDCFYLAVAQHLETCMVTVDARLLAAVKGTEAGPLVCHLRDVVTA